MPPRDPVREGLERLSAIRDDPRTPEAREVLRSALAGESNVIVARAASICASGGLHDLVPDLEVTFQRFMTDPLRTDPSCHAKTAIVRALAALGGGDDVLVVATRHTQPEPTAKEPIDTAVELRAAAIVTLTERNHPRALELASDLLADREPQARLGAITSFRALPSEGAAALLRYKALRYLRPPEYESQHETRDEIAETLATLLVCSPESLALVSGLLDEDAHTAALACIAVGESAVPGALEVLRRAFSERLDPQVRHTALAAAGMLRDEAAAGFLLEVVAGPDTRLAQVALESMVSFLRDPAVKRRAEIAVRDSGSRELLDALRRLT